MKPPDREWRPVITDRIPEGLYEVSEYGDVWSVRRGKILSHNLDRDGYHRAHVTYDYKQQTLSVARLVGMAFIGPPPDDMKEPTIDHIDFNRENNHYSNLRWVEKSKNSSERLNIGVGEQNSRAILKEEDVKNIYFLIDSGRFTNNQIANMYGIATSYVSSIKNGKTWKHLYNEIKVG